ncbi:glycosyltransferase family 39 protein [Lentisphaerota bacterium ZTH]|nr:glycosyltransferase family 39 protein [Lentisphaerota bacterium]WET06475.1 glycosyltransferase family 39 protein [Lentisphaerota bacterium ZTH]
MSENNQEQAVKKDWSGLVFWVAAVFILFGGLGYYGLWASEERWAEIAREMILFKDFFHPAINGEVYFDKPLLSYWFIVGAYYVFGILNEFIIRLPSALAGLAGLYGTIYVGTKLYNRKVGITAGWLLLSSYGFIFWARVAAADMANLAAIILAVAWFLAREKKAGFFSYLIFYLICFLGAMTKGLPALVMPIVVIAPYLLMNGRWKKHLKFSNFLAAVIGLGVYYLPFHVASTTPMPEFYTTPPRDLTGLQLVWRENILRVFQSFDHNDEPFYCYFYQVPRIMIPWVLFLAAAVGWLATRWKRISSSDKWLTYASILIFILFSASGSRRWYYILPIMPFLVLIISRFLNSVDNHLRWESMTIEIMRWVVITAASLETISIILLPLWSCLLRIRPPWFTLASAPVLGVLTLTLMFLDERHDKRWLQSITGMPGKFAAILLGGTIITCGFFVVQWPSLDMFRTEKPFALQMKTELIDIPARNIVFFKKLPPKMIFYMELSSPAPVIDNASELKEFLSKAKNKVAVVSYNKKRYLKELKDVFPKDVLDNPNYKEIYMPFERSKARKLYVWIINKGAGKTK